MSRGTGTISTARLEALLVIQTKQQGRRKASEATSLFAVGSPQSREGGGVLISQSRCRRKLRGLGKGLCRGLGASNGRLGGIGPFLRFLRQASHPDWPWFLISTKTGRVILRVGGEPSAVEQLLT